MVNLVIFASGSGTNAENIIQYFKKHPTIRVKGVFTNNPDAGVIERCKKLKVPVTVFTKKELESPGFLSNLKDVDFIILAGFLLKIPEYLVQHFHCRILNIHPALLPKFGGKGMYGRHVHNAVIEKKETHSGITIHLVNEEYDQGDILFQKSIQLDKNETVESLENKIHQLEYKYYPRIIEEFITSLHE